MSATRSQTLQFLDPHTLQDISPRPGDHSASETGPETTLALLAFIIRAPVTGAGGKRTYCTL